MRTFIALVLVLLGSAKAFAFSSESVRPVIEKYKLEGIWRKDCSSPLGAANEEIRFRKEAQGTVMQITDGKYDSVFYVLDAEAIDARFVKFRVRPPDASKTGFTVVFESADGRIRVYSNVAEDGRVFLEKGVNVSDKRVETFVSRCS
jgi:hypothetical protein